MESEERIVGFYYLSKTKGLNNQIDVQTVESPNFYDLLGAKWPVLSCLCKNESRIYNRFINLVGFAE
jgi:hypothetical protein